MTMKVQTGMHQRGEERRSGRGARIAALGLSALALAVTGASGCTGSPEGDALVEASSTAELTGEAQSDVGAVTCVTLRGGSSKTRDAMLSGEKVANNYGSSTVALIGAAAGGVDQFVSLFQFDTAAIPVNATITSAIVSLSQTNNGVGTWNAHLITTPWNEATVTWASFGAGFDPGVLKSGSTASPTLSFDLKPQLQAWVSGAVSNQGFLLKQSGPFQTKVKSREWAVAGQRPTLVACYTVSCAPGFADCNGLAADGCEADLASPQSCGACGNTCVVPQATAICNAGSCAIGSCDPGFGDCDGNAANGCETGLTSASDCGACEVPCALPGAVASCASGSCKLVACDAGTFDCDGDAANGCEPIPCADGAHCGEAGGCVSQVCVGGLCAAPACNDHVRNGDEADVDCGGACPDCLDFQLCTSSADCGSGVCIGGVCQPASCADGVKNGNEIGVDCGGSCAVPEVCNGVDDDCNGSVDEGLGSSTCGLGVCQVTVQSCVAGVIQACVPGQPSAEVCDGLLDEDCDGVVDDGCACVNGATEACYTGPAGTQNVGLCHGGSRTCSLGQWGACAGQVTPSAEACDGVDNDCDANVDERGSTVLWHRYDDSASPVTDHGGNGFTGVLSGPSYAGPTPDGSANALSFAAGNTYNVNGLAGFNFGSQLTVQLWIKWVGLSGSYRGVVGNGYFTGGGFEIRFGRESAGTRLGMRVNTVSSAAAGDLFLSSNVWHHVAMVYNGSSLKGYLDGAQGFSTPLSGAIKVVGNALRVGNNIGGISEPYAGFVDDLRIDTAALPPGELALSCQ